MTESHPLSGLAPLWLSIHGLGRPSGPSSADAVDVATEIGYEVHAVAFQHTSLWDGAPSEERVAFARRLLCVGPEHDDEIAAHFEAAGEGERRERRHVVVGFGERASRLTGRRKVSHRSRLLRHTESRTSDSPISLMLMAPPRAAANEGSSRFTSGT